MFPKRNCAPLMTKHATDVGEKPLGAKMPERSICQPRTKFRHQRRVYKVYEHDECNDADDSKGAWVYSIVHKRSADAKCRMFVNGEPVFFQIDTGVTVNTLPARCARYMVPYKGVLTMWNKTVIQP
ncbi:hypothetical protein LSAT2_030610 [Lamellibrachia satsuma]|nr:hypothetical protein LSAT2_030610 [Lamellibrachia satsuma]